MFEGIGYDIYTIYDGADALDTYIAYVPDVVIMDYEMPRMDGIEAMLHIINEDSEAKIIMCSGRASIKNSALQAGAIDFFAKPISPLSLADRVKELVPVYEIKNNKKVKIEPVPESEY